MTQLQNLLQLRPKNSNVDLNMSSKVCQEFRLVLDYKLALDALDFTEFPQIIALKFPDMSMLSGSFRKK